MKLYMTAEEVRNQDWQKNPMPIKEHRAGVYRIVDRKSGELLYIGQSINLRGRLYSHNIFDRRIHDVYVLFVSNKSERQYMEYRFIALLKPPFNQRNGVMPRMPEELLDLSYHAIFG